jgi:transcriptional regulator GlxA family with amidase domain
LRAAFVIFEGMTALDFVGAYDPLTRLGTMRLRADFAWDVCALTNEVRDHTGLRFAPTRVGEALGTYDLLVVPGGHGARELAEDAAFLDWLRTAAACDLKASVCTGSLLLGAAGFLAGRRATTHPSAFAELKKFCAVSDERIVDEGDVVTAGGVTAAIDLGLHLCERLAGAEAKEKIRRQMDYH